MSETFAPIHFSLSPPRRLASNRLIGFISPLRRPTPFALLPFSSLSNCSRFARRLLASFPKIRSLLPRALTSTVSITVYRDLLLLLILPIYRFASIYARDTIVPFSFCSSVFKMRVNARFWAWLLYDVLHARLTRPFAILTLWSTDSRDTRGLRAKLASRSCYPWSMLAHSRWKSVKAYDLRWK